ncbi:hypothetical protein [Nocardia cyriacigeorgica]|uniref:hypothetical protein n=1 Tax=Nocardia cyriacigeorgica TaxID=135487 RepID=UPI00245890DD|nr:hypothetical protein [Nocardia cyriacigeorgica]
MSNETINALEATREFLRLKKRESIAEVINGYITELKADNVFEPVKRAYEKANRVSPGMVENPTVLGDKRRKWLQAFYDAARDDLPKGPRIFEQLSEVPKDIQVTDRDGDLWKYFNGDWHWARFYEEGELYWHPSGDVDGTEWDCSGPFTEVLDPPKPVDTTPHGEGGPGSDTYISFLD